MCVNILEISFRNANKETNQIEMRESNFITGEREKLINMVDGTEKYLRQVKMEAGGSSVTKVPMQTPVM
jgi:hypothetical protein